MSQSLEVTSLLERFDINQDDLAALKTGGDAMKAAGKVNAVIDSWYVWLEKQPEFPIFFSTQETVERVKRLQTGLLGELLQR